MTRARHDIPRFRKLADEFELVRRAGAARLTDKDIDNAVTALRAAADDLDQLLRHRPIGCTCREIANDDGYSHFVYDEKCQHHRAQVLECKRFEDHFKTLETKLRADTRMKLILAALPGVGDLGEVDGAKRAMALADEIMSRLERDL